MMNQSRDHIREGEPRLTDRALNDRVILEWPKFSIEDRVLDVGCGQGYLSLQVAPKVRSIDSIDKSTDHVNSLIDKIWEENIPNVIPRKIDLRSIIPYDNAYFSKVVCFRLLSSIEKVYFPFIFREFYRVLKPGGSLFFTILRKSGRAVIDPEKTETLMTKREIQELFMDTDFRNLDVRGIFNTPNKWREWADQNQSFQTPLLGIDLSLGRISSGFGEWLFVKMTK